MENQTFDLETLIQNNGRIEQTVEIDPVADIDAGVGSKPAPKEEEAPEAATGETQEVEGSEEESNEGTDGEESAEGNESDSEEGSSGIDEAIEALKNGSKKTVWDKKSKDAFKNTFGSDDPDAFLGELNTMKESLAHAQEQAKKSESILAKAAELPYELAKAVEAALNGKDYKGFIKELASGVTLSKDAKDLDKAELVGKYYKGKFSSEDIEAIKSGDADDDLLDRFGEYHSLASEKHNSARAKEQSAIEQASASRTQAIENDKKSAMEAVAYAKNDPIVSKLINELPAGAIDEYISGDLEAKQLYNDDGTRSKSGLALLVKGMLFDRTMTRMMKGVQAASKAEAKAKQHAGLPDKPALGGGKKPVASAQKDGPKLHPSMAEMWSRG